MLIDAQYQRVSAGDEFERNLVFVRRDAAHGRIAVDLLAIQPRGHTVIGAEQQCPRGFPVRCNFGCSVCVHVLVRLQQRAQIHDAAVARLERVLPYDRFAIRKCSVEIRSGLSGFWSDVFPCSNFLVAERTENQPVLMEPAVAFDARL